MKKTCKVISLDVNKVAFILGKIYTRMAAYERCGDDFIIDGKVACCKHAWEDVQYLAVTLASLANSLANGFYGGSDNCECIFAEYIHVEYEDKKYPDYTKVRFYTAKENRVFGGYYITYTDIGRKKNISGSGYRYSIDIVRGFDAEIVEAIFSLFDNVPELTDKEVKSLVWSLNPNGKALYKSILAEGLSPAEAFKELLHGNNLPCKPF